MFVACLSLANTSDPSYLDLSTTPGLRFLGLTTMFGTKPRRGLAIMFGARLKQGFGIAVKVADLARQQDLRLLGLS